MKFEIKAFEFLDLLRISSVTEVFFWILTMITSFIVPSIDGENFQTLALFQIFHPIRAALGIYILCRIPKTYELLEKINNNLNVDDLKTKTYNNILKDLSKDDIIPRLEANKLSLMGYFFLTCLLMAIDIIGFFYVFSKKDNVSFAMSASSLFITFILMGNLLFNKIFNLF